MTVRRKTGAKFAAGFMVSAVAIAALLAYKKPAPDNHTETKCPEPPPAYATKGDGKCEVAKGEADSLSKTFDPESCGYCGDDVRQINAAAGSPVTLNIDTLLWEQEVTERPSETKENCPADFHCGNRFLDKGHIYSGVVYEDSQYKISTIKRVESCNPAKPNFCPLDCRLKVAKDTAEEEEPDDQPQITRSSVLSCSYQIAGKSRVDFISLSAYAGTQLIGRLASIIKERSDSIREVLGEQGEKDVKIIVSMDVSPSGLAHVTSTTALCNNTICDNSPAVSNVLHFNLQGIALPAPGKNCRLSLTFRLP
ncbi:hypothetical protein JXA56_01700 [Candidatus Micrarchaeota archaeon]|nr:hypothetical protein [Candidatus Micrarchaeota archaeon]